MTIGNIGLIIFVVLFLALVTWEAYNRNKEEQDKPYVPDFTNSENEKK